MIAVDAFHWLLWLTLLYAAVLVLALAGGLIAIARALTITRKNLAQIEAGLTQVQKQTEPLGYSLSTINTVLAQTSGGLSALLETLLGASEKLSRVAGKLTAKK